MKNENSPYEAFQFFQNKVPNQLPIFVMKYAYGSRNLKVREHFATRKPCLIAIEACGSGHYWARELQALSHTVRLLHAKIVRPFVSGMEAGVDKATRTSAGQGTRYGWLCCFTNYWIYNKTDATDARAIWLAVQQPGVKYVGVKTVEQQATLTLHRQRESLMKMRIMQTNALRGLLYEFGATFAKGKNALFSEIEATFETLVDILPKVVVDSLREQVVRIKKLDADMLNIEKRLKLQLEQDPHMQRIAKIPGVGLLTATAAIATMGDASAFKSGREFCAWLGLVPTQTGTGGKVKLGCISKRGDTYLRTLLIHGARSVVNNSKTPKPWLEGLKARRPANVVCVAQAAKMARTIWAITAKDQEYQRDHKSVRPQSAQ